MKLDIACGNNKRDGYVGIDYAGDQADIKHDLFQYPWPIESESVSEVWCAHFFEHIPGLDRPKFMNELYRILKPKGIAVIICPSYNNARAYQDFTHAWPPVCAESFQYFNREWREINKLTHGLYDMPCDFEYAVSGSISPEFDQRTYETKVFAGTKYWNVTIDIHVTLTKK